MTCKGGRDSSDIVKVYDAEDFPDRRLVRVVTTLTLHCAVAGSLTSFLSLPVFFLPFLSLSHPPSFNLAHLQRTIRNFIFSYFLPEMKEKVFSLYFLLAFTPLSSETRVLSLLSALGSTSQAEHWNHFLFYRKLSTLIASDWENFVQLNSSPKY